LTEPSQLLQKAVKIERARLALQDWMIRVQTLKKP
jgi:hypothetical protein